MCINMYVYFGANYGGVEKPGGCSRFQDIFSYWRRRCA